jgi:RNA polymerase sigma-70 factor, ECF subfamily
MAERDGRVTDAVRRHQRGDPAALADLVALLKGPMLRMASWILADPTTAEDAFIDAMSHVLREVADFGEPDRFGAYARRAVRNRCVDVARSRSSRDARRALRDTANLSRSVSGDGPYVERLPSPEPGPEADLLAAEERRRVGSQVEQLKEPGRTIIRLFYAEGLTYQQIGERLDLSEGVIKKTLGRCRLLLATRLREEEDKRAS